MTVDLRIGTTLSGYELTKALGRGPLGETFIASDAKGRDVVVKVVHGRLSLFAQVERFWKTQTTLAETANPHVAVPSDSTWTDSGRFLMVLEPLDGVSLETAIAAGPLAPTQVLRFAGQVCLALESAHGANIVHGGITSRNILLVRTADASRDQDPRLFSTRVTDFAGHLLRSDKEGVAPTPGDDLRSLALVMVQALLGATTLTFAEAQTRLSEVPAGLRDILRRSLADDPTKRYTRVVAFREALEAWAAEEPSELKTEGPSIFATSPKDGALSRVNQADKPSPPPSSRPKGPSKRQEPDTVATDTSDKTQDASVAPEEAPEDAELAAMAELATAPLREARKKKRRRGKPSESSGTETKASTSDDGDTRREPAPDPADETEAETEALAHLGAAKAAAEKAPAGKKPAGKKSAVAETSKDDDSDLSHVHENTVTLPVERTVRAFVDGISPTVPARSKEDDEDDEDDEDSLDAALDGFMRDAKKANAALPPPVVDDAKLAALAKATMEPDPPPVALPKPLAPPEPVGKEPSALDPASSAAPLPSPTPATSSPAPLPAAEPKSSVGTMLLAALIGALVAIGAVYMMRHKGKKAPRPVPSTHLRQGEGSASAHTPTTSALPSDASTKPATASLKADGTIHGHDAVTSARDAQRKTETSADAAPPKIDAVTHDSAAGTSPSLAAKKPAAAAKKPAAAAKKPAAAAKKPAAKKKPRKAVVTKKKRPRKLVRKKRPKKKSRKKRPKKKPRKKPKKKSGGDWVDPFAG